MTDKTREREGNHMWVESIQDLTQEEYGLFRDLVYAQSGINLGDKKMQLVRARLGKRLRNLKMHGYREYYEFVKADKSGRELTELIDAISTNTTHLFRENQHFQFLEATVKGWMQGSGGQRRSSLRIWSAGCSSGEEPYSIVMTMDNLVRQFPGLQYKILATDISTRMLERASQGIFSPDRLASVPSEFKQRYFQKIKEDGEPMMQINPDLRKQITFSRLNLMDERYPFRNGFDVIFCRNVMIYFDRPTQEALVGKYTGALLTGGYLLIGHSESLNNIKHSLTYVMPTVYRKP
jgi:chemotaxis protein methyltransferase CheR